LSDVISALTGWSKILQLEESQSTRKVSLKRKKGEKPFWLCTFAEIVTEILLVFLLSWNIIETKAKNYHSVSVHKITVK